MLKVLNQSAFILLRNIDIKSVIYFAKRRL